MSKNKNKIKTTTIELPATATKKQLTGIKKTEQNLINLFNARFSFLYISTWEEIRAIDLITEIAGDKTKLIYPRTLFIWSATEGLLKSGKRGTEKVNNINDPSAALNYIENLNEPAILIMKDLHNYFGVQGRCPDYNLIRKIRDVAGSIKNSEHSKNVVIIAPSLVLPVDLQKDITVVDFDLPTLEEIKVLLDEMIYLNHDGGKKNALSYENKEMLCKAAQGLTFQEAENAFARAMASSGGELSMDSLDIILDEKCQVIKKTGILEYINTNIKMYDVGGLENLKKWLLKRNNSWLEKAQKDYNLPSPKGVLITGVPGCGKSLTAKAVSAMWQLPLLRLDVGKIFSGLVGSSEENMRKAIKTAEAVSPSILWVDEIEKGFGSCGNENDGGTTTRVFGTFLTWLSEKTKPVFVIATANNINALPSEMLRKGRFDEIFFVDLPTKSERKAIFQLHLKKRLKRSISKSLEVTDTLLDKLAEYTEGFSGSEIEQIVISALFEAFSKDRELKEIDLLTSIKNTIPLSTTQSEQIIRIREWANDRAIAATSQTDRNEYSELTEPEIDERKQKTKNAVEKIKHSRGGRTVDF